MNEDMSGFLRRLVDVVGIVALPPSFLHHLESVTQTKLS